MHPGLSTYRHLRQTATVLVFAAFLLIPIADNVFHFAPNYALNEKRALCKPPRLAWSAGALRRLPRDFEKYYNDAFGGRNFLTFWYNDIKYRWLRESPTTQVLRGREGWLYYGPDELVTYQRTAPYAPDHLRLLAHYFKEVDTWLQQRHTRFVVLVIPNKSTVYPEHMPRNLRRADLPSRTDQLVDALRREGLTVVDMRPVFAQARATIPLYYRLDSHWTPIASHIAYRAVLASLQTGSTPAPGALPPWSLSDTPLIPGDLATLMGLDAVLKEPSMVVDWQPSPAVRCSYNEGMAFGNKMVLETDQPDRPVGVLLHDSFAMTGARLDPLAVHFRKLATTWTTHLDPDYVQQQDPDVLIFEFVERILSRDDCFGSLAGIIGRLHHVKAAVNGFRRVGTNVLEPDSVIGSVRRATASTPPGWLLFGGYEDLAPGSYEAVFRLRARPAGTEAIARVDVSAEHGARILAERTLDVSSGLESGVWEDVRLPFTVPATGATQAECRVEFRGGGELDVDYVTWGQP
ncbi:MAG: hypothetical protein K8T26_03655 [Lentisphaerae bacterium]|nr:hypothetical protein [Lentisphaerota bacterium]